MKFKLFDVAIDGKRIDTGKIATIASKTTADTIKGIFALYGFDQYHNYYNVTYQGNNAVVRYNYHEGEKDTWFLEYIPE